MNSLEKQVNEVAVTHIELCSGDALACDELKEWGLPSL